MRCGSHCTTITDRHIRHAAATTVLPCHSKTKAANVMMTIAEFICDTKTKEHLLFIVLKYFIDTVKAILMSVGVGTRKYYSYFRISNELSFCC